MSTALDNINLEEEEPMEGFSHTYLDNSEYDADSIGATGSEESDTDARNNSFCNGSSKEAKNYIMDDEGTQNDGQAADHESEITFLRLKLKLLVKESNEEYNEVCIIVALT